jgi:hypothetical protein
MRRLYR